jgi:NTP pyrophosphatase (non-canonical NTP hydrolase)
MTAKFDLPRISDEDKASILNAFSDYCKFYNKRWWPADPKTRNVGEAIALMHSELSEALEGYRKDAMDEHLPQFKSLSVELADCLIRIFDFAETFAPDLGEAFIAKMAYNQIREDHKLENRLKLGGKKF